MGRQQIISGHHIIILLISYGDGDCLINTSTINTTFALILTILNIDTCNTAIVLSIAVYYSIYAMMIQHSSSYHFTFDHLPQMMKRTTDNSTTRSCGRQQNWIKRSFHFSVVKFKEPRRARSADIFITATCIIWKNVKTLTGAKI